MPRKQHIRLLNATFAQQSSKPTDQTTLYKFTISSAFDQIAASAMGIKESWYDEDGHLREQMRKGEPGNEYYGATVACRVKQGNLWSGNELLQVGALKVSDFKITRHKDNDALVMRFVMTLPDGAELQSLESFYRDTKTSQFDITIEPPSKEKEQVAMTEAVNLGLFGKQKDDEEEDGDEEDGDEEEEDAEPEEEETEPKFDCKHCNASVPLEEGGTHHLVNGRRVKCQHANAAALASKAEMERLSGKAN